MNRLSPERSRSAAYELFHFSDQEYEAPQQPQRNARAQGEMPQLVAEVAAAYFAANPVTVQDIPTVFHRISSALAAISDGQLRTPEPSFEQPRYRLTPEEIKATIGEDYLISLEDGRPYKSLRRHLTNRGITPEMYRAKWGLPANYPMISENYSKRRSQIARGIGLGLDKK